MRKATRALVTLATLATLTTEAQAAGFQSPALSVAGLSEAGAVVADSEPVGNYSYNPAGMVFYSGTRTALDVIAGRSSTTFSNASNSYSGSGSMAFFPTLTVTHRFQDTPLAVGLAVNSPFYLKTQWSAGAFPSGPYIAEMRIIDVNPSVAYLVLPSLSIGVGVDYYQSLKANFDGNTSSGSGVGGSVGLFYSTERWNAALAYKSQASVGLGGTTVQLPNRVQGGFRYRFTPSLSSELDVAWTDWGNAIGLANTGWKSAVSYRLGMSYHVSDDLAVRAGYAYDPSPVPDNALPYNPDANGNIIGLGAALRLGVWNWDLGASYNIGGTRTVADAANPAFDGSYKFSSFAFGAALSRDF